MRQQHLNDLCNAFTAAQTKQEKEKSIRELLNFIEGKKYDAKEKK